MPASGDIYRGLRNDVGNDVIEIPSVNARACRVEMAVSSEFFCEFIDGDRAL
jgi:hypothetical protein